MEITKLFSSLDTTNKTNMKNDFNNKINDLQSIINNYCRANNISAGNSGYLSSIGNISSIFNTLLNNL